MENQPHSDTPRTLAEWQKHESLNPRCAAEFMALCMELERELTLARASDPLMAHNAKAVVNTMRSERKRAMTRNRELSEEVAALKKALEDERDRRKAAENEAVKNDLMRLLVEQDMDTVREIITKGGSAADVLKFLNTGPA